MKAARMRSALAGVLGAIAVGLCACSSADETYVRFTVDGHDYAVSPAIALAWEADQQYRIQIGPEDIGAAPAGTIHWRGTGTIAGLAGQEVDLSGFMNRAHDSEIIFRVTRNLNVGQEVDSRFSVRITEVTDAEVVGTFSGTNLYAVEMTGDNPSRRVNISGQFRAHLLRP